MSISLYAYLTLSPCLATGLTNIYEAEFKQLYLNTEDKDGLESIRALHQQVTNINKTWNNLIVGFKRPHSSNFWYVNVLPCHTYFIFQLDDDQDGAIEPSETADFIR